MLPFLGRRTKDRPSSSKTHSDTSKISSVEMNLILESLQAMQNRESTRKNYYSIWKQFNAFILRLDYVPNEWEEWVSLFGAYLTSKGTQSSTIRSYVSAIKHILKVDKYEWDDNKVLLSAITRACKIKNDVLRTRLPIHIGLLEMLLFEVNREFQDQPYLRCLYLAMFIIAY